MEINSNTISFGGATKIFQRQSIKGENNLTYLSNTLNTHFVGSIPNDIVSDIVKMSASAEDKKKLIKSVMQSFSTTARHITGEIHHELNYHPYPNKFMAFIFSPIKFFLKDETCINGQNLTGNQFAKIAKSAGKRLSKEFKKHGLIKKGEKIDITYDKSDMLKNTFNIVFPKSTNYKPKTLSIYNSEYPEYKSAFNIPDTYAPYELNQALKSEKGEANQVFGSITENFILRG